MASESKQNKGNMVQNSTSVRLKYVKLGYHNLVSNAMYILLVPLLVMFLTTHLSTITMEYLIELENLHQKLNIATLALSLGFIVLTSTIYFMSRPRSVYLADFSCYKAGPSNIVSREHFMRGTAGTRFFTEESLNFMKKIIEKSGYGQTTYAPKGMLRQPMDRSFSESLGETKMVIFGVVDELLRKTGVSPKDIGILVVNSSCFNPTPSWSATVVNHYKLRGNILSYKLGGMGCSAGLISIDLAKHLLLVCLSFSILTKDTTIKSKNIFAA